MPRRLGRPEVPDGYGVDGTDEFMEWSQVESRLSEARHYWVATTHSDGRPHIVPRWGVWLDAQFWYDGSPDTRHARNLRTNPNCALHLESGVQVTILNGTSQPSDPVHGQLGERLSAEFGRKYRDKGYAPGPDSWSDQIAGGLLVFTPRFAMAWSSFPKDLTKFAFE